MEDFGRDLQLFWTLTSVYSEPVDAKRLDRQLAYSRRCQICNDAPHCRGQLKSVRRKPKTMKRILVPAGADDGNSIWHIAFNAGPATNNCCLANDRENTRGRSRIGSESSGIQLRLI